MPANRLRMAVWLAIGLALYLFALLSGPDWPQVQVVAWKLGHVTVLAWAGYWIARQAIGRLADSSDPQDRIARAIVMAGVIMAGSMGL